MAMSLTLPHNKLPFTRPNAYHIPQRTSFRASPICLSMANSRPELRKEDVVIVGAGIAGLATAVSLQRFGNHRNLHLDRNILVTILI